MQKMHIHKAHPWHGIELGENAPEEATAFIEIVPTDTVKYEVDKKSGYLSVDRPQQFSNIVPCLYGFFPKTYCHAHVAELTNTALGRSDIEGDGDPLDVCILTEKDITHGDIIAKVRPIGGFRLLDHNQADDKIIAVLKNDIIYGKYGDIGELPEKVVERMIHYFTTYKDLPTENTQKMKLTGVYGRETAHEVIRRAAKDYDEQIGGNIEEHMGQTNTPSCKYS